MRSGADLNCKYDEVPLGTMLVLLAVDHCASETLTVFYNSLGICMLIFRQLLWLPVFASLDVREMRDFTIWKFQRDM